VALSGLLYAATTLWTLSYAFRRSTPRTTQESLLDILPE
jgi:hypothetical protein